MQRNEFTEIVAKECVNYRGDGPCEFHKRDGAVCRCAAYTPYSNKMLFILLSSRTDVIRSSVVLNHMKGNDPNSRITCVTHWPELLPNYVDEVMTLSECSIMRLNNEKFDQAYNFGLDRTGAALMGAIKAGRSYGFELKDGTSSPIDSAAEAIWQQMLFPKLKKKDQSGRYTNRQQKIREMFDICQAEYLRQLPVIENTGIRRGNPGQIAIVTGLDNAGALSAKAVEVSERLSSNGFTPIMLAVADDKDRECHFSINGNYVNVPGHLVKTLASSEVVLSDELWAAEYAWASGRRIVLVDGRPESEYSDRDFSGRGRVIPADADTTSLVSAVSGLSLAHDDNENAGKLLEEVVVNVNPVKK